MIPTLDHLTPASSRELKPRDKAEFVGRSMRHSDRDLFEHSDKDLVGASSVSSSLHQRARRASRSRRCTLRKPPGRRHGAKTVRELKYVPPKEAADAKHTHCYH